MRRRRDTDVTWESPPGSLAEELFRYEQEMIAAERRVEVMLDSVYGSDGYSGFDYGCGELDIYSVIESPAAVDALLRSGFSRIIEHPHPGRQFVHCDCRRRTEP